MVFPEQKRNSKAILEPVEKCWLRGRDAMSSFAGNQKNSPPAAQIIKSATRIPDAVSFISGQYHSLVQTEMMKSDRILQAMNRYCLKGN